MAQPSRGEVWLVDFDPTKGHEQAGRRPAVVVSVNGLNRSGAGLVMVLPITSRHKQIRSHIPIQAPEGGIKATSYIKCENIRSIASERLIRRWGRVEAGTMNGIADILRILLGI